MRSNRIIISIFLLQNLRNFSLKATRSMARFDWVPYLEGKYLSYYEWFGFIGSFASLVLAILSFFTYLILCKIELHQNKYKFLSWASSKSQIIDKLKTVTFNAGFIFLSLIPLICQALDIIYLIEGILGQFAILLIGVYLDNGRKKWNNQSMTISTNIDSSSNSCSPMMKQYISQCLKLTKSSKKRIIVSFAVALIVNLFTYKTCLCFFNEEVGYYSHSLGFGINTCITRALTLKESCPVGGPCQMYTTIPQNPSQAIFLNLHTHVDVKSVDVYYQQLHTSDVTKFDKVTAELFPYEGLQRLARRNVHTALLSGLKPSTKYLTKVFYNGRFWTNAILKTLPSPGDKKTPVRMINAGDSGYNQAAVNLSKIVAKLQPDVFFMGGDIAYDDNMPACAYTWDYFFGMYGKITATVGYLMPIVATVGNHDVGLNELPGVNITVSNEGPAFHIYFPQHYQKNLDGHIIEKVPSLSKRRTMFNFTFGNVHYVALDSGYLHGFDGYQKKFMIDSFQANKDKIKFVNYHVPIYSVCEAFDRDPTRFLYALFHWVPQFDKYHVMASFENHVHSFKRTKPLVGSTPTKYGTVYLGDGAYGAIIKEMCQPDATIDIFDAFAKRNNFWLTEITENKVQHWAYDSTGQIIDHFIQYPENYTMGTIRGDLEGGNEHEMTIEKAKKIVDEYYVEDSDQSLQEKLPYRKREEQRIIQKLTTQEQISQKIKEKQQKKVKPIESTQFEENSQNVQKQLQLKVETQESKKDTSIHEEQQFNKDVRSQQSKSLSEDLNLEETGNKIQQRVVLQPSKSENNNEIIDPQTQNDIILIDN